jgi:3-methyladenine DNA glycosylase/8-oxoguanine DNA glycosylase
VLSPNSWEAETRTVTRIERLSNGKVVRLEVSGAGTVRKPCVAIVVESRGRLSKRDCLEIEARVGHMFRLDEDLAPFYRLCRKRGDRWRKVTRGLGRLLRSPSLWEDVVKVICTTNIQWGGTKKMATGLVDAFGEPFSPDLKAFPAPEAIASVSRAEFASAVSMGYRAPYVHELAQRVAGGDLDLEALAKSNMPTPELKKELLAIKGVGNYAAATLLMLLGRYDELAVDTVARDFCAKQYFDGRKPSDAEIKALYEDWGEWMFLAYWFDLWEGVSEVL